MFLRPAYGDKTDIFAGLGKIIFKIHRPVGVNLGRQMKDSDGLNILFRTRILNDPNLGSQRAEGIIHVVKHDDCAAGRWNVLAEFFIAGVVRLIAGEVHVVGADGEPAHVLCQSQSP